MQMFATIRLAAWLGHKADLYFWIEVSGLSLLTLVFAAFGVWCINFINPSTKTSEAVTICTAGCPYRMFALWRPCGLGVSLGAFDAFCCWDNRDQHYDRGLHIYGAERETKTRALRQYLFVEHCDEAHFYSAFFW